MSPIENRESKFGKWNATYRLQIHAGFPLSAAAAVCPYLRELGISHVYLSPCLQAAPGSTHGYDVADPTRINDEIGGEEGWAEFQRAARDAGLGVLLDIVPNHMTTHPANPWWSDVLAHGPYSEHAGTFDVFPFAFAKSWKLAICTLGKPYGQALLDGDLEIDLTSGLPRLRYFETTFPLTPSSWRPILGPAAPDLAFAFTELAKLRAVPAPTADEITRHRVLTAQVIARAREVTPGIADVPTEPEAVHAIIDEQYYRLAYWKLEGELVNYRRFFNIGTLIAVRTEAPQVFDASHARIAQMVAAGEVEGLRVDHPDGLRDPRGYFQRLRALLPDGRIYAEKILDAEEMLPGDWPIDGTVGYEFLSKVNRLWMDETKAEAFSAFYADFTGHPTNYAAIVREQKAAILATHFISDLDRLANLAIEIATARWRTHDLSRLQLREAISLLVVALPIYRTYLTAESGPASPVDDRIITEAVATARAQAPHLEPAVFEFLDALLTNELNGAAENEFIARWQQLAPAVMAKGAEDTSFYRYDRLVSCNEVGSQPSAFGISADQFHQFCAHLQSHWPRNLLPTSTHDNKRSEDVRVRIDALTEVPEKWIAAVLRWSQMNLPAWKGREADRHAEYLLYQTLVGAWPITPERTWAYMEKAVREAKLRTTWHEPNSAYEESLREFTESVLANEEFTADLGAFVEPLVTAGRVNSLAQTLIKMTAPGTPDFYQGTELWDLSLVDPDNRRPVDFDARRALLAQCGDSAPTDWDNGAPKLWLIHRTLAIRAERAATFESGSHQPLSARGAKLGHLLAYLRGEDVLVALPRFTISLGGDWADTVLPLPAGEWRNVFTNATLSGEVSPDVLFNSFPVALLTRA